MDTASQYSMNSSKDHCPAYSPSADPKSGEDSREAVVNAAEHGGTKPAEQSRWDTMLGLTSQWANGTGPTQHKFVDDTIALSLQDSDVVNQGRKFWYDQVNTGQKSVHDGVTNFKGRERIGGGNFGLIGLVKAGFDPVEQFVGSYCLEMRSSGQQLTYTAYNTSSLKSAVYGIGPEFERDPNQLTPRGNTHQTYKFSEPIDFNRINK